MQGIYDIHTHILPMVDDGAASIREALSIIEDEAEQGVGYIMLTPHYREKIFETDPEVIYSRYEELLEAAGELYPDLDIRLGCELHVPSDLKKTLHYRNFSSLDDTKNVLLEFSSSDSASFIKLKAREVLKLGYFPILAHVERYPSLMNNMIMLELLKESGVRVQINADAVLGESGGQEKKSCQKLLKKNLVDFIASDVHNMTTRKSHIGRAADQICKQFGKEYAEKIFIKNPEKLFEKS